MSLETEMQNMREDVVGEWCSFALQSTRVWKTGRGFCVKKSLRTKPGFAGGTVKERECRRTEGTTVYISEWYHSKGHFHLHWFYSIEHINPFVRCVVLPALLLFAL